MAQSSVICQRCGLIDDYRTVPAGPHIKAICNGCNRYIKFVSQNNDAGRKPVNTEKMGQLINGSLCLTDIVEHAKKGHSAFNKGKNGKIYFNITEWVNDEKDDYGNDVSFLLNSSKEKKDAEGKIYIGNGKKAAGSSTPIQSAQSEIPSIDDLPF